MEFQLFVLILVITSIGQIKAQIDDELVADVGALGLIGGTKEFTFSTNKPYIAFYEIPYASPDERFKVKENFQRLGC